MHQCKHKQQNFVILPTALIFVIDSNGTLHQCRALLDSGSQGTLITEECVQRTKLKKQYDKTVIFGLASTSGNRTRGKVSLRIKADGKIISTEALCLSNLTQILPALEINSEQFTYFKNLNMADPNWSKSRSVDIILGADVFMNCCLCISANSRANGITSSDEYNLRLGFNGERDLTGRKQHHCKSPLH